MLTIIPHFHAGVKCLTCDIRRYAADWLVDPEVCHAPIIKQTRPGLQAQTGKQVVMLITC